MLVSGLGGGDDIARYFFFWAPAYTKATISGLSMARADTLCGSWSREGAERMAHNHLVNPAMVK